MDTKERQAHDEVLRICRTNRPGTCWCMRDGCGPSAGRKLIIDNARWNGPIVAEGATWAEVMDRVVALEAERAASAGSY